MARWWAKESRDGWSWVYEVDRRYEEAVLAMVRSTRTWVPPDRRAALYLRASHMSRGFFALARQNLVASDSDGKEVRFGIVCVPQFLPGASPCATALEAMARALTEADVRFNWEAAWAELDDDGVMTVLHVHDLWAGAGSGWLDDALPSSMTRALLAFDNQWLPD